jgi:chemotaxis protein CheZ
MSSAFQADINRRLELVRSERGNQVNLDEVAEVVVSIMSTLEGDVSSLDLRVYKELDDLAQYIQNAKSEIASLAPDQITHEHLPAAAGQLDAIVAATEEATSVILDAVEVIGAAAGKLKDKGKPINDQVIRIFEACSFQDITGQRINKVVTTLKHIEDRLDRLVRVFGDEMLRVHRSAADRDTNEPVRPDDGVTLEGPTLKSEGSNRQAEIDALLASLD